MRSNGHALRACHLPQALEQSMSKTDPYKTPDAKLNIEKARYTVEPEKKDKYFVMAIIHTFAIFICAVLMVSVPLLSIFLWLPVIYSGLKLPINLISFLAARKMVKNAES